jgi:hypothetical protein
MGAWLVLFVGVIYLVVAADFGFRLGNWYMAVIYFGYAVANVGLFKLGGE